MSIRAARDAFAGGRGYLAACTMGLPTRRMRDALAADLDLWAAGQATPGHYTEAVDASRALYARLVGVAPSRVAIGSQTSAMVATIAASVPDGAEVVCVAGDFTSIVTPFTQQAARGITVRHVPLTAVADAIGERTWLVAFSLVQSATGEIADADAIVEAARRAGAFTLCDTTQAAGWLPVDAARFDATVCHAYKWLCAPRGVAFLTVSADFAAHVIPQQAAWYAGEDPWCSCYGPDITLAADARRYDVSPAWQAWVGAREALAFACALDQRAVAAHDGMLGDALCAGLALPARGQAIVAWPDADGAALRRLTAHGITASGRAGRVRVAFHLWNDLDDVETVLRILAR